jgi:hypothetical protein
LLADAFIVGIVVDTIGARSPDPANDRQGLAGTSS